MPAITPAYTAALQITGIWRDQGASRLKLVGRQCGEPGIVHGATQREVIQALPGIVADSKQAVHFVIEEAADPCGAYAGSLGFKIENLPEHSGFPEEMAVAPWFLQGD